MLWLAFFVGFAVLIVVAPKEYIITAISTPRGMRNVVRSANTEPLTRRARFVLTISIITYVLVIYLFGSRIVDLVMSTGTILEG